MIVDENLKCKILSWLCIITSSCLIFASLFGFRDKKTIKELSMQLQQDEQLLYKDSRQDTLDAMIVAFAVQESNTTENAVSDCGKYVGCIQMSKIMVDEANRILGYDNFTHDDRFVWDSCARMFEIVQTYHNPTLDIDKAITIWNKGCPNSYRNNVKKVYKGVLRHLTNE